MQKVEWLFLVEEQKSMFTTDTAATLRAIEMEADAILKELEWTEFTLDPEKTCRQLNLTPLHSKRFMRKN